MDTLITSIIFFKSLFLTGSIYKYSDPFTADSYPVIEANLSRKNFGISYWGGVGYHYISLDLYKSWKTYDLSLSINPFNPDEYSQTLALSLTKNF